ncbi:MAG: tRNA (N6-threonylcarbamoyladenosine(37)-N6)-methyltransferase TrmO [Rhizobiaceae bacterium]|nr:tRNA (N6-threonylcarbamoyladenosine(37)-N6)-methyltransferase TrmO [Rhizobiaceae bacterium]
MHLTERREGEIALPFNPGDQADATIRFIGRVTSPWTDRGECPKNMTAARETGQPASIEIDGPFRQGLLGLEAFTHAILLSWFDRAQRNLIVQKPRHASDAKGVFALRSPVRPNPVGLHVVRLTSVDLATGLIGIDAIDLFDGTPVVDVKPYFSSVDAFPDALRP